MFHKVFTSVCTAIGTVAAIVGVVGGFFMLAGGGVEMLNPLNWPGFVQGVVAVFTTIASFVAGFATYLEMDEPIVVSNSNYYYESLLEEQLSLRNEELGKLEVELEEAKQINRENMEVHKKEEAALKQEIKKLRYSFPYYIKVL